MFLWILKKKEEVSIKFRADNFWIMSHCKKHLERMLKDFIEEVDLESKPASLRWTSTYTSEKEDMILGTLKGCYKVPFEDEFKILGCLMNRQGNECGAVQERMQLTKQSLWKKIP